MRNLNRIELEFVTKCPNILEEEVFRPVSKKIKTIAQKLNDEFADVVYEMNSYSVKNDEVLRDLHKTAYEWAKDETPEIINEVITSYCPIRMSKKDISAIINNAVSL